LVLARIRKRRASSHPASPARLANRRQEFAGRAGYSRSAGRAENAPERTPQHTRAYGGQVVGDPRGRRRKCLQPEFSRVPAPWETGAGQARLPPLKSVAISDSLLAASPGLFENSPVVSSRPPDASTPTQPPDAADPFEAPDAVDPLDDHCDGLAFAFSAVRRKSCGRMPSAITLTALPT
jgi:hypothetical protein